MSIEKEAAVEAALAALPVCGSMVEIASPSLDAKYPCSILVGTQSLARWARQNAARKLRSDPVVWETFVLWLERGEPQSNKVFSITRQFYSLISGNVDELVGSLPKIFRCKICTQGHGEVVEERQTVQDSQICYSWHVTYTCPNGHLLLKTFHEMHLSPAD